MNVLFLCSKNKLRSPTAEHIFADHPAIEVDSAGLSRDAEIRLSPEQIHWADLIFLMEKVHRKKLNQSYQKHLKGKRLVVLNIPDNYPYLHPELIELLQKKCDPYFPA